MILVVDFGGQYNLLIARRVRELNVYCEVVPYTKALEKAKELKPQGIIFTGGPNSVYDEKAPRIDPEIFQLNIPILGLCYGMQLIAQTLGGKVTVAGKREFGKTALQIEKTEIFTEISNPTQVWMSHADRVTEVPEGFEIIAKTENCPVAAMQNTKTKIYAMQYHPEVNHTLQGKKMLENFIVQICGEQKN